VRNMAEPERKAAEQPFIITVGVSTDRYVADCAHVLRLLRKAGYEAAPTRHESIDMIAADHELLPQLREAGVPAPRDEPPEVA
jgi:hypothetical protein